MPDNLSARPLAADTIATDYVESSHHIRVKVQHGADGSATDVSSASPMPVTAAAGTAAGLAPAVAHTLTGTPPVSQIVLSAPTTYLGIEVSETTETARASVVLYDNTAASGTIISTVTLAPGESRDIPVPAGRRALVGVYAQITGSVRGSVFASA